MATIERAVRLAAEAHEGQVDKSGLPYILHPLRVMAGVDDLEAKMVAVLHDVLEDTAVTVEQLREAGFSSAVIAGVLSVTHGDGEDYADYVVRAKADPLGRLVKLSDLADNTRLERAMFRLDNVERDVARMRKYLASFKFLTDEFSEEEYRRVMAGT